MTLIVLLLFLILIYLILDYHNSKTNNNENTNIKNQKKRTIYYKNYYQPKKYVLSLNELNFYNTLMEIAKEMDLIIFAQVSLYNIVETKLNLDYKIKMTYFNKIASKSIDFVLVDKKDTKIKLCIELDDNTHKQKNRIERDIFVNELFKNLEIDLLRYPTYKIYYKDALKKKIQENIKEHYYTN